GEAFTPSDVIATASFIDPFPGSFMVASIGIAHDRSIQILGAMPAPAPTGIRYFVPFDKSGDCGAVTVLASTGLGYAKFPTLAGTLLDHDTPLHVDGDATLSWPTDLPVDVTIVTIQQV